MILRFLKNSFNIKAGCKHDSVEQYWLCQGVLMRKCINCDKSESWDTTKRFNELCNPKHINGESIHGIELEKINYIKN